MPRAFRSSPKKRPRNDAAGNALSADRAFHLATSKKSQVRKISRVPLSIQRKETVGPRESVAADDEVHQKPLGMASARASPSSCVTRKAGSSFSPHFAADLKVNRNSRLVEKLIERGNGHSRVGKQFGVNGRANEQVISVTHGIELGSGEGCERLIRPEGRNDVRVKGNFQRRSSSSRNSAIQRFIARRSPPKPLNIPL